MMRDAATLLKGRFGRPDVHAAVDQHRIGIDDLGPSLVPGESARDGDRQAGFPTRGGAADDEGWQMHPAIVPNWTPESA